MSTNILEKKKYTRKQIAERIIDHGDLLVIYLNKIYRLNAWIKHHPGGEMAILHMVGKVIIRMEYFAKTSTIFFQDATDEINAYHSDHILRTKLPSFYFGDVDNQNCGEFKSLIAPIQLDTRRQDINNNQVLTSESLLHFDDEKMIQNSNEHKHIIQAYRQLDHKLRFLGKTTGKRISSCLICSMNLNRFIRL